MKHKLLYILFIALFGFSVNTQAGFFVKRHAVATEVVQTASKTRDITSVSANVASVNSKSENISTPPFRNWQYRGWVGEIALALGIMGLFLPLFSIAAILFGFIGMNRHNRNRGLAVAGFVLGVAVIVGTALFGLTPIPLF